jgi:peptidoglycan/xylan/chitin deacetylase (PgdA/CDA1 family)
MVTVSRTHRLRRATIPALAALLTLAACSLTEASADDEDTVSAPAGPSVTASPSAPTTPRPYANQIPRFAPAPVPVRPRLAGGPQAPVFGRVPTSQRVAFITIDDGMVQRPEAQVLLKSAGVPVSLFLISSVAAKNPAYFGALQRDGAVIQSHTIDHPGLRGRSYATQKRQICGSSDQLGRLFGRRPVLFRPPYGEYDHTTLRAAKDCGMKAVLHWKEATNGGTVFYQTPVKKVQPGDIILLHFRPAFVADFLAVLNAIHDSGLTPARLEDYLG